VQSQGHALILRSDLGGMNGTSLAPFSAHGGGLMKSKSRLAVWASAAAFVFVSAACDNTARGVKQDAEENKREAAELGSEAKAKAEVGAEKTENAAERAAGATTDAARDAVGTTGAAIQTVDVKAALMVDKRVDASGIDVDTDYQTRTVVLKGHVPNAAQKKIAEDIAAAKAEGYSVKNELIVR
jgi:predicted small secreted protein